MTLAKPLRLPGAGFLQIRRWRVYLLLAFAGTSLSLVCRDSLGLMLSERRTVRGSSHGLSGPQARPRPAQAGCGHFQGVWRHPEHCPASQRPPGRLLMQVEAACARRAAEPHCSGALCRCQCSDPGSRLFRQVSSQGSWCLGAHCLSLGPVRPVASWSPRVCPSSFPAT